MFAFISIPYYTVCLKAVTCNNGVALVVEGTREDLICVSLQDLQTDSRLHIPQTSSLVCTGSENSTALRVKADLQGKEGG